MPPPEDPRREDQDRRFTTVILKWIEIGECGGEEIEAATQRERIRRIDDLDHRLFVRVAARNRRATMPLEQAKALSPNDREQPARDRRGLVVVDTLSFVRQLGAWRTLLVGLSQCALSPTREHSLGAGAAVIGSIVIPSGGASQAVHVVQKRRSRIAEVLPEVP